MEKKKEELRTEEHESGAEAKYGRSRRSVEAAGRNGKKRFPIAGVAAAVIILAAGGGGGYYLSKAVAYNDAFLPNTTINGIDVSGKNVEEVKIMIDNEISGYDLAILDRNEFGEVIKRDEIGLRSVFDGSLEEIMSKQEPMKWITALWTPVEYEIQTMLAYDETMLTERVSELSCMNPETMVEPEDAYLTDYQSATTSYEIVEAVEGTELVEEHVRAAIAAAVMEMAGEVDLDAAGCYTKPSKYSNDPELVKLANELNRYVGAAVNHTFGDTKEVLNGDTIHKWLTIDGTDIYFDESQVSKYIRSLAKKYNTAYSSKKLETSYGVTVTVPAGPYGWRMNETKETEAVLDVIMSGNQVTREPEWIQKGASHGEYDFGDTYVEVNLTAQHIFFYKDGKLVVEADFVSGKSSKGWDTPAGAYPLTYKQRNATLRGEDYATPVSYWMPFNGNIGLHDADWRASFGGDLYKNNGSHGCVNLPPKAAKLIYENISPGDPVLCYHLEGTESTKTTKASDVKVGGTPSTMPEKLPTENDGGTGAETKPAETKPTETKPAESKPAETTVPETTAAPTTEAVPETTVPMEPETSVTDGTDASAAPESSVPVESQPETVAPVETAPIETSPAETTASPVQPQPTVPAETNTVTPGTNAITPETTTPGSSSVQPGTTPNSGAAGPGASSGTSGGPGGPGSQGNSADDHGSPGAPNV